MKKKYQDTGKHFIIIILLITMLPFQPTASGERIDSLRNVIASHPSDEEMADAMNAMAKEFKILYKSDSIKFYADSALKISTRNNYTKGITSSNITLCTYYWSNGQLENARVIIPALLYWAKKLDDNDLLGKAYYNAGVVYGMTGNPDSALYFFKTSLALNLEDSTIVFKNYNGLGNIYKNIGDERNLALVYSNIGSGYNSLRQYDEAEKYIRMGLEFARKCKAYDIVAGDLSRLSAIYYDRKEYVEALKFLDSASALLDSIGDYSGRNDLYRRYGMNYEGLGKSELALTYYLKAYENSKSEIDPEGMITSLQNIAWVYAAMGKHDIATAYLDSGLTIAFQKGYQPLQMMLLNSQAEISYESRKYKQAYDEFKAYFHLYDTLNDVEKTKVINEVKLKYEKEKDQAQIFNLEKEALKKTLQRNLILFNSSALLVAALFFLMLLRHKLVKTRLIAQQKVRELEEEAKIKTARKLVEGQEIERKRIALELHDGLGVLLSATKMQFSALQDNWPKDLPGIDKAIHLLEEATREVRRISHHMMPGLLTKLGLYEALEDLVESINDMEKIQASVEIEGKKSRLPENIEIMVFRIIQEMVNNTLKYAKASRIELSVKISNPSLLINYKDDGIGFDVDRTLNSNTKSLGLKSIESRVDFLNGELKIESAPGNGVNFLIRVPVKA
jgi:two-component system NarL family sensor kinase